MKLFSTVILFFLMFLFSLNSFSQECNLVVDQIDEFTKTRKTITDYLPLYFNKEEKRVVRIQAKRKEGKILINGNLTNPVEFGIEKGNRLMFLDTEGNTVVLESSNTKLSSKYNGVFNAGVDYEVSEENYLKLKKGDFEKVKMETTGKDIEIILTEEYKVNINTLMSCIE